MWLMEEMAADCRNNLSSWREGEREREWERAIDHTRTHCSQAVARANVNSFVFFSYRSKRFIKKTKKAVFRFCFIFYKKKIFQENETKRNTDREGDNLRNRRCTLKRSNDTEKEKRSTSARYHFLVARADDDRPVSVPVGNCCLELLDADGGGCVCWISLGARR